MKFRLPEGVADSTYNNQNQTAEEQCQTLVATQTHQPEDDSNEKTAVATSVYKPDADTGDNDVVDPDSEDFSADETETDNVDDTNSADTDDVINQPLLPSTITTVGIQEVGDNDKLRTIAL